MASVLEQYFEHLSPSRIASAHGGGMPGIILEKCFNVRSPSTPNMHRGTAIEHGIVAHLLHGETIEAAIEAALKEYDALCRWMPRDGWAKQRTMIEPLIRAGIEELRPYGKPSATQTEILHQHPDLKLPIKGFLDLGYDDHGLILDVKTKHKAVSEIPTSEARQVAFYTIATGGANYQGRLLYLWNTQASGPKGSILVLENAQAHYDALIRSARNVERFLALSSDPAELLALSLPDVDHWKIDAAQRQKIFEVLGI